MIIFYERKAGNGGVYLDYSMSQGSIRECIIRNNVPVNQEHTTKIPKRNKEVPSSW